MTISNETTTTETKNGRQTKAKNHECKTKSELQLNKTPVVTQLGAISLK